MGEMGSSGKLKDQDFCPSEHVRVGQVPPRHFSKPHRSIGLDNNNLDVCSVLPKMLKKLEKEE
jgi:hypothetical protein